MTAPTTFGRRAIASPSKAPQSAAKPPQPSISPQDPTGLSPEAEAFRAELAAGPRTADPGFADWRRSRRGGQILTWALTLFCLSPGLVGAMLHAPMSVCGGLEVLGLICGAWLRGQRRRRLRAIVAWDEPAAPHTEA